MPVLYDILSRLISLYELMLFIWIILGWLQAFGHLPYSRPLHTFMMFLHRLLDPALRIARSLLPPFSGLDLSPILVFLAAEALRYVLHMVLL